MFANRKLDMFSLRSKLDMISISLPKGNISSAKHISKISQEIDIDDFIFDEIIIARNPTLFKIPHRRAQAQNSAVGASKITASPHFAYLVDMQTKVCSIFYFVNRYVFPFGQTRYDMNSPSPRRAYRVFNISNPNGIYREFRRNSYRGVGATRQLQAVTSNRKTVSHSRGCFPSRTIPTQCRALPTDSQATTQTPAHPSPCFRAEALHRYKSF